MTSKPLYTLATLVAYALLAGGSIASAQDIEFMGKNGEKVQLTPKVEALPGDLPTIEVPRVQPNQRELGLGNIGDLSGRTFTVTDSDGNTKEINTDNARSVIVNRSFSTVIRNGQREVRQGGTAVVVDADGQSYEIDLGQLADENVDGKPMQASPVEVKKSYMIGVFCEPVPEMLRSQLDLGEGVGLMVKHIQEGSPASVAGLQKYDILLYADDQSLLTVADLSGVVTETGSQSQPFTLTVMRGGEEIPVEVTASERELTAGLMPGGLPMGGFEMNDMGPGLIFGGDVNGDMMDQIQNHMQQVREQMERMDGLLQNRALPLQLPDLPMQAIPKQQIR